MIGQLLDRRYRIIKVTDSSEVGKTYIAADTHRPGYPQCTVREMRLLGTSSQTPELVKIIFQRNAEIIEKLGKHDKIPELLAYFEENQSLYLIEEFIAGQPLSQELIPGEPWAQDQVIALLSSILEVLVFIHSNGFIHRRIQPDRTIRRESDGKFVLIDFSLDKEINPELVNSHLLAPTSPNSVKKPLGKKPELAAETLYVPIEQSQGNPRYNSDIYALGTIAQLAVTGLSPEKLSALKNQGEISWRDRATCSAALADIIDRMVRSDCEERYQEAAEVLADLEQIAVKWEAGRSPATIITDTINQFQPRQRPTKLLLFAAIAAASILTALIIYFWHSQSPARAKELFARGVAKAQQGDKTGAIADYTQAIALNSSDAETFYKRANARYDMGATEQAIADYTQALKVNPSHTKAIYNRALARRDTGDKRGAVEDFTQVLRLNPNNGDIYYQRGLAYYDLADYRAAIEDYTQAIRLNPNDATAYSNRGLARSANGDKTGAMADFTQAIQISPKEAGVYYSRGRSRFNLADYQGAMEDYSRAIELEPNQADAYTNRCSAYLNLATYDKAIEDCSRAIRLDPKDEAAYNNRCIAHLNLKQFQKASEDCSLTIGLNSNNPKAYSNRGLARSASGDKQGAVEDFTQAIKLNPSDAVAYSNRGTIYSELKNYPLAVEDFAQSLRLNPNNASAFYSRGLVRRQLKDRAGAIEDFQKAATLFLEQGRADGFQNAQAQIKDSK
ncbi:tetratricopeptide repeat protein [Microcoleus sp. PH2017_30_WIL_O_A]|uniref:tetratricopeptide repeat protein n=1 Tax=Microcoleus sp. PH2017_30_WIL_O_A TaxID=2798840 RepID=UPI001DA1EB3E|nr:tetratricopeptide repeat protein [Microcoleus sp. PH2017_30_WIL_O_A]MCC3588562.1 tetratricopeptide repeat protein [Microcoleus sp. PH2017_30_WIL_O_A]